MIPKTSDRRVLFVVPLHERALIGTTDTLVDEPSFQTRKLWDSEIEFPFLKTGEWQYLSKNQIKKMYFLYLQAYVLLAAPKRRKQKKEYPEVIKLLCRNRTCNHYRREMGPPTDKWLKIIWNKTIEVHQLKNVV